MASFRLPGQVCMYLRQRGIDAGTLCRETSPTPGHVDVNLPFWLKSTQALSDPFGPSLLEPKIAWGDKVSPEFKTKVLQITGNLGIDVDYLMAAMAFETGGSFSAAQKNNSGSSATGLIQFMATTAKSLGTTTSDLAAMTEVAQLDYVEKYFKPYKGKLKTLEDLYMAILYPVAIGKPNDHVLFTEPSLAYTQNAGLDANKDGKITKAEAAAQVRKKYEEGLKHLG